MAWGSWLSKNKYAAMGAGAAVVAATAATIYWGVGPYPTRQLIAGGRFDSIAYFDRHAQPFWTKPAAAAKAWGWTMQEAAGNLTDTLSGDSEVLTAGGTPLYSRHTNIPRSDGFTWKAIAFNRVDTEFTAANNTKFDFPTENFTLAFWVNLKEAGSHRIVYKQSAGAVGYQLNFTVTTLSLYLMDTGGHSVSLTVLVLPASHTWNHVAVSVNRVAGTATGFLNGVAQTPVDISPVTDSITNNGIFTFGGCYTVCPATRLSGNAAGLMIANGVMTQDEVTANYRAFKLPNGMNNIVGTISASQTTHRAYEIANVGGWGTQLGAYAGNATAANVQFPTSYSSTLVSTTNPGGLQTPAIAGMANVLGYAREFNSWTASGYAPPAVTTDAAEAPDGLQTAERVAFDTYGPIAYPQNSGVPLVPGAHQGGARCPGNGRIYLAPNEQSIQANWHYIDTTTGNVVAYAHGMAGMAAAAYAGAVYDPVNDRIYFVPFAQGASANWHYVDCATGTVVAYAAGAGGLGSGYVGGAYDPVNSRIYFAPHGQGAAANWHYIDLATGAATAYAHGAVVVALPYAGAGYDSVNGRIWFCPYGQSNQANWHYINLATGVVTAYAHGMGALAGGGYAGVTLDSTNNRLYLTPFVLAPTATWHYVNFATATVVAYAHGMGGSMLGALGDGVFDSTRGRVYFPQFTTSTNWYYIKTATNTGTAYTGPTAKPSAYYGMVWDPTNSRGYFVPYGQSNQANWHYIGAGSSATMTSTLTRAVVGGGTIAAGERWHGQLYYRYVSGAACDIRLYNGTTRYVTLDTTATWHKAWVDNYTAAEAKQLYLSRNGGTDCVYDFSDAQYYSSQFYIPAVCTIGYTGASAYTCNAQGPSFTMSAAHLAMLPVDFRRGEMTFVGSNNQNATSGYSLSTRIAGPGYYSFRAVANTGLTFMNHAAGGGSEAFEVGRPLAPTEEKLTLSIPWDAVDGLTNTNPRKRFAGISNGYPATSVLSMRSSTETVGLPSTALAKTAMYASSTYPYPVGGVESFGVYTKPAHVVYPTTDPKHVLTVDTSGPAYLQNSSIPRFECPAGVDTANCTIWDQSEWETTVNATYSPDYAPPFYDRINGTALTAAGGDNYSIVNSGLMARGAGRLAVNFTKASTEAISAANTAIAAPGSATEITLEVLFRPRTISTYDMVIDSSDSAWWTGGGRNGLAIVLSPPPGGATSTINCAIGNAMRAVGAGAGGIAMIYPNVWVYVAAVFKSTAGTWDIAHIYVNGIDMPLTNMTGVAPVGNITYSSPFTIGKGGWAFDGHVGEVMLWGRELSAGEILAHYKTTTQTGQAWNATGQTNLIAHWPLNEYYLSNGTGVADDSGNGNNLTVVTASPDGRHDSLPWPAGSDVSKLGVETYSASSTYWEGSTIAPDAANPMSMMAWIRCPYDNDTQDIVAKQGGAPDFRMWLDSSGRLNCQWRDSGANATTSQNATDICDGVWHLVGCKLTYSAPNYVATSSINGGAFGNAGGNISGVLTGNAGAIRTLQIANAADRLGESGLAIIKNYAISDSEIAGYNRFGADPTGGQLTYVRTTTNNKVCHITNAQPSAGLTVTCFPDSKFPFDAGVEWGSPTVLTMPRIAYEHGPSVAFPIARAVTNYAYNSQAFGSWTLTNVSATTDDTTLGFHAPDGTATAEKLSETAVNAIHSVENTNTANVALNGHVMNRLFFKAGTTITWIKLYIKDTAGNYYWSNFSTTGTMGNSGLSGANWAVPTTYRKIVGSTGWIMAELVAYCTAGGGCAGARVGFCIETADNNAACPSYLGVITKNIYAWEGEMLQCSFPGYNCWNYSLCPTIGAATATCNAPTSIYVPAASLAAWDRSTGAITQFVARGWDPYVASYGLDLHNGVNLNGAVRSTSIYNAANEFYLYDNVGVLQQRVTGLVGRNVQFSPHKFSWDSTVTFDTGSSTAGLRRSHAYTYDVNLAGAWDLYTTDLGANWTPAAATNLWIGMDNAATATSFLNGFHLRTTIHTR